MDSALTFPIQTAAVKTRSLKLHMTLNRLIEIIINGNREEKAASLQRDVHEALYIKPLQSWSYMAHHVLLGCNVFHGALCELWSLLDVMPDAAAIHSAVILHGHLCQHPAHIALESPAHACNL